MEEWKDADRDNSGHWGDCELCCICLCPGDTGNAIGCAERTHRVSSNGLKGKSDH